MKVIRRDMVTGRGVFSAPGDLAPVFDRLRAIGAEPMAAGVLCEDILVISTEPTVSHAEISAAAGVEFEELVSGRLTLKAGHAALTLTERHVFVDLWFRDCDLVREPCDSEMAEILAFLSSIENNARLARAYPAGFSASVLLWSRDGEHVWTAEGGCLTAAAQPAGPLAAAAAP